VSTNRRRRSHTTSQYASVLAALADMWRHRPEHADPSADGRSPDRPVVSLTAYRDGRRAPARVAKAG
jgi:hypothetical protein